MIYLDYSATTKADSEVLRRFVNDNELYFANSNSVHTLGKDVVKKIDKTTKEILSLLNLSGFDLVYTSGASESNNLAIKGVALASKKKKIITSGFEHSSVVGCLNYLVKLGYEVEIVETDKFGLVDLFNLESLIDEDTCLVTIGAVNSETGILQDIKKISEVIKKYPEVLFHSDMTQAIGKVDVDLNVCDLISFSCHKFYGIKGIGGLFVKKGVSMTPVIHGGKSLSKFRGGTPPSPLIFSVLNSMKPAIENLNERFRGVKIINEYLNNRLSEFDEVIINSNQYSIPQILNVSFLKFSSRFIQEELSKREIFVSTTTACASGNETSLTILKLTNSLERANSAIRISLSHLTTKEEIDKFVIALNEIYEL